MKRRMKLKQQGFNTTYLMVAIALVLVGGVLLFARRTMAPTTITTQPPMTNEIQNANDLNEAANDLDNTDIDSVDNELNQVDNETQAL